MYKALEAVRTALFGPKGRPMNKILKWIGIALVLGIALGVFFDEPKTPQQKPYIATQSQQQAIENNAITQMSYKNVVSVLGWISVICFVAALLVEPKIPKRDGRFTTGFKGNATIRKKTPSEIKFQIMAIAIGALSAVIWNFIR